VLAQLLLHLLEDSLLLLGKRHVIPFPTARAAATPASDSGVRPNRLPLLS
jgi:hypothetical protein